MTLDPPLRAPRGLGQRGRDAHPLRPPDPARQRLGAVSRTQYTRLCRKGTHLANEFSRFVKLAIRHPRLARILNLARSAPVELRYAKDGIVEDQAAVFRPAERATRAGRRTRGKIAREGGSAFRVSIGQTRVRRARLTSKGRRIGLGSSSRPEPSRWTTWLARREKERKANGRGDSKPRVADP